MKKRRVTLTLDADILEVLEQLDAPSVSAAANASLRRAVESELHRRAALEWLDQLDHAHGTATTAQQKANKDFLDTIGFDEPSAPSAAAA